MALTMSDVARSVMLLLLDHYGDHEGAQDASGREVPAWSDDAVSFDLISAICHVHLNPEGDRMRLRLIGKLKAIGVWGMPNPTQYAILAGLARALEDGQGPPAAVGAMLARGPGVGGSTGQARTVEGQGGGQP